MLLLVDEVKKRTEFLNTYIDNLSQSINKRRYNQALSFINQQRPAINHTNVTKYNPNTFIIDSLKTKNQNLTQIKKQLQKQKSLLQKKLDQHNKNSSGIKQKVHDENVQTVISKIEITLKDIKRIEYQPMIIQSNYDKLTITTTQGKQTILQLTEIFSVEKKPPYILLHYKQQKDKQQLKLWIMLRFIDEVQLSKWQNLIMYGKMVQQAKSKRYLFLGGENYRLSQNKGYGHIQRKGTLNDQSEVIQYTGQIPTQGIGFRGTFVPQKQQQQQHQRPSNTSSIIRQRQASLAIDSNTQSYTNPQQQLQKQMTNSLFLTPIQNTIITKKPINNYSTFRPTPLNRIRGKSMYLQIEKGKNNQQYKKQPYYNNYDEQKGDFFDNRSQKQHKSSHKNNFRKASQDITLRLKNNPNSQQRKLQKFRSQRNLIQELMVQSTQVKQAKKPHSIDRNYHSTLVSHNNNFGSGSISGNSRRIEKQIQKKNEFLQRINMNFYNNNNTNNNNLFYNSSNKNQQNQLNNNNNNYNRKQLQTTARWFTQQDLRSQSVHSKKSSKKSQFTNSNQNINNFPKKILYNKQNKQLFEQQVEYSLQDQSSSVVGENNYYNYNQQNNNSRKLTNNFLQNHHHHQQDQIIQASQSHQISPTFPKKIVYEDGSHIRLYPVQFTNNSNNNDKNNNEQSQESQTKKQNNNNYIEKDQDEKKDNVFIQTLQQMQQNQLEQSRHGIRNDRLNTLDSQTDKDQQNHTNEMNESNSQDHQQQQFQQLIDELKKGLILTKCSQGSFWTRQKQIKLSQNQNTLLIIDIKDKKIKKLPISEIQNVQYGKFSKGIIKHIPQIEQKKCLIINVKQGKSIKKIQFVGNNPQKLALFTQNLAYFVQMFKAS